MGRSDDLNLPADTPWLLDPKAQAVCAMLEDAGHQALFVGGCVRNALLGTQVSDIDISTDAPPDRVMEIAGAHDMQALPTGIAHGTVTLVLDGTPFEVTTFRRDVATDGRRAVVAFSDDIADDARRRDFTMNALYATRQGQVIDPLGGLPDLQARRVRFIEDAGQRIREDYLRILRFFRFSAWYGDPVNGFEAETLAAIAAHLEGLQQLSAERVGAEMLKLLAAPDPARAVATMVQMGVFAQILPLESPEALGPLVALEDLTGTAPDGLRRLASLNPQEAGPRLRLSKQQVKDLQALRESRDGVLAPRALGHVLGAQLGWDALLLRAAGLGQPLDPTLKAHVAEGAQSPFPVQSSDLRPAFEGAALGEKLRELKARWLASDLTLGRDALLG